MKKTTLATTLTLIAALGATATLAEAKGRHGGPRVDLTEMDTDGDGAISRAEVTAFHQARFDEADADRDGSLSLDEMIAMATARFDGDLPARAEDRIGRMFSRLDADDSGGVTFDEQRHEERTARMFERLDTNEDGTISADELEEARAARGERGKGNRRGDRPSNG